MTLARILNQEQDPIFTAISVLTTLCIWIAIIATPFLFRGGWAALSSFATSLLLLFIGLVVNYTCGQIAFHRREFWGARIALFGVALWLLTILIMRLPFIRLAMSRTWLDGQ
jgi:hypothetical protein